MTKLIKTYSRPNAALNTIEQLQSVADDALADNPKLMHVYVTDDKNVFLRTGYAKDWVLDENSPALYIYWYHKNGNRKELPLVIPKS